MKVSTDIYKKTYPLSDATHAIKQMHNSSQKESVPIERHRIKLQRHTKINKHETPKHNLSSTQLDEINESQYSSAQKKAPTLFDALDAR